MTTSIAMRSGGSVTFDSDRMTSLRATFRGRLLEPEDEELLQRSSPLHDVVRCGEAGSDYAVARRPT